MKRGSSPSRVSRPTSSSSARPPRCKRFSRSLHIVNGGRSWWMPASKAEMCSTSAASSTDSSFRSWQARNPEVADLKAGTSARPSRTLPPISPFACCSKKPVSFREKDAHILYVKGCPEILAAIIQAPSMPVLSPPPTLKARQANVKEILKHYDRNIPCIQASIGTTAPSSSQTRTCSGVTSAPMRRR